MLIDRNQKYPFVIISFNCISPVYEENILNGWGFTKYKQVNGRYNGNDERSWLVLFNGPIQLKELFAVAKQYKQESILVVDSERNAELLYMDDGRREKVGRFKSVKECCAKAGDNYTYCPQLDTYYKAG